MSSSNSQVEHVTINVNDVAAARRFYAAALGALGLEERTDQFGRVGCGRDFGMYASQGADGFRHAHVAFVDPEGNGLEAVHRPS